MDQTGTLLRKKEVASRLSVGIRTVDRLIAARELDAIRVTPRATRITAASVEAYLRRCAA